jgi:xanthine dehydrogenase YagR molybdenum-binding subunit
VGVYTNTGPAVAFRAPGHAGAAFALESAIDELARALQLDPIELWLRNYTEEDQKKQKPYTSADSLRCCYQRAAEVFGWPRNDHRPMTNCALDRTEPARRSDPAGRDRTWGFDVQ